MRDHIFSLLAVAFAACLLPASSQLVTLGPLVATPPVTNWLLTPDTLLPFGIPSTERRAWAKLGKKIWTFLQTMDHDFVDSTGKTVPPRLPGVTRKFPAQCGRFARQMIRIPFHDCGTFDVGDTGSVGSTNKPQWGCNGSIRKELGPCTCDGTISTTCGCWNGWERRFDVATGTFLNEDVFQALRTRFGSVLVDAAIPQDDRPENSGFGMTLAFLYQVRLETVKSEDKLYKLLPSRLSMADVIQYAGALAVAKCGGPQVEFQPGRPDAAVADPPERLPAPIEPLTHTISYFWVNGVTNWDMVNLLAAHSTACFSIGCLDETPTILDTEWAQLVSTITTGTAPIICQFNAEGTPLGPARELCTLPADAELNARQDIRDYLNALQSPLTDAAAIETSVNTVALNMLPANTPYLACDSQALPGCQARPAPWVPFRLLTGGTSGINVNMCTKTGVAPVNCAINGPDTTFKLAMATSWFKMSKWFGSAGSNAGAAYDVQKQPCQPGLIRIGGNAAVQNPVCNCCPDGPCQDFQVGLEEVTLSCAQDIGPASIRPASAITEARPAVVAGDIPAEADGAIVTDAAVEPAAVIAASGATVPQSPAQNAWARLSDNTYGW